jgi:D-arabinose 1-dehydrogenase-like Zn-dependent alcohol dehydrogenase
VGGILGGSVQTDIHSEHLVRDLSQTEEKRAMPRVLITGANRGLGLEFARQYAADGWDVIATGRNPEQSEELERLAQNKSVTLKRWTWPAMSP